MTDLLSRPEPDATTQEIPVGASTLSSASAPATSRDLPRGPGRLLRAASERFDLRTGDLPWFLPVWLLGLALNAVGLFRVPQYVDDEGTYTAQAFAIERLGELTHYTYWYDHPPLGWLQMAGWTSLTGAFDRYPHAVMAGREVMMVALVLASVLVWTLTRRLGFGRPVAAAATAIFLMAPLAVQFHRTVYLDNIATVWILAAFVLATVRSRQLAAFLLAGVAAAVAVLTKETYLLLTPFVAWMMIRNAQESTRRYTLVASAAVFSLLGAGYVVFALVKGELMPGADRVSLWDGIAFQLVDREASGSVFTAGSLVRESVDVWIDLSPGLLVAGGIAMVAGLFSRTLRPLAAALALLVLMIVRPGGYVPVPHVVAMLPLIAVLVPAVVALAWRRLAARSPRRAPRVVIASVLAVAVLGTGAPHAFAQWRGQVLSDLNSPIRDAIGWVEQNVPRDRRLIVDDVMWVDLYEAGFDREDVIWYYKVDTDPAVIAQSPDGWRDADYVITTDSMLTIPGQFPRVSDAIENSVVVAAFGEGDERVEIRLIHPEGIEEVEAREDSETAARVQFGSRLAENPNLSFADAQDAESVAGGLLDPRAALLLADLATRGEVEVAALPEVPGEGGLIRRTVVLTTVDGAPVDAEALAMLTDRVAQYAGGTEPAGLELEGDRLTLTFTVDPPQGLLPAASEGA